MTIEEYANRYAKAWGPTPVFLMDNLHELKWCQNEAFHQLDTATRLNGPMAYVINRAEAGEQMYIDLLLLMAHSRMGADT